MKQIFPSIVACCLVGVCSFAGAQDKGADSWGTNFKETCFNPALDADVSFPVRMPPKVAGLEKYPLVVVIKNGLKVAPSADYPFIEIKPPTGGIWGYRSMSGVLVRTAIDHMKQFYPIDEDRIYLVGFSAGASGAMQVASTHADQYAAVLPLVAVGTDYPIANFRNLPVAQHHGTVDWTSAICNARGQHQRMLAMGCPAELTEYEGVGHSVPRPHEPIVEWMLKQKRDRSPELVFHRCDSPSLGRAYWISVQKFLHPHRRAEIDAKASERELKIYVRNVRKFSIDFELLPIRQVDDVKIESQVIDGEGWSGVVQFSVERGLWERVVEEKPPTPRSLRAYHAGAAANLYEGEPLLVVYGTGSRREAQLAAVAKRLAACGGPHAGAMPEGFRVVADRDLSLEQQKTCNLILLGAPGENLVIDRLLPSLPLKLDDQILVVDGREDLALNGRTLSLLHPNPEHPERLVYLVSPFLEDQAEWKKFAENPQRFLIGSDGFDRISQADLAVKNVDQQFCRQMQFGHDWKWMPPKWSLPKFDEIKIPQRFAHRSALSREYMRAMLGAGAHTVDVALWWGPADKGMWGHDLNFLPRYDPDTYTMADFRTQHRKIQTLKGSVSGAELREIWDRWGANEEMLFERRSDAEGVRFESMVDASAFNDEDIYRITIPMDFYIKLGQRKKALVDPEPGPEIDIELLEEAIFRE